MRYPSAPPVSDSRSTADTQAPKHHEIPPPLKLETTCGSILHPVAPRRNGFFTSSLYWQTVCLMLGPLVMLFAAHYPEPSQWFSGFTLFVDGNVVCMFLLSLPYMVCSIAADDASLNDALEAMRTEGSLIYTSATAAELQKQAKIWFKRTKRLASAMAVAAGGLAALLNYKACRELPGLWQSHAGSLNAPGTFYLIMAGFFWSMVAVFVVRSLAIAMFLQKMVPQVRIKVTPFHPDRCSGLGPIGKLGLRNQYILTIIGINIGQLLLTALAYLPREKITWEMCLVPAIVYLLCGPVAFLGPLLPFRDAMKCARDGLSFNLAQSRQKVLSRMVEDSNRGNLTAEDEAVLNRQAALAKTIDEIPVWPFDMATARKFILSYVTPLLGLVGVDALTKAIKAIEILLRSG